MRDGYTISPEQGRLAHPALDPLYRQHYAEMQARLAQDGVPIGPYAPRLDEYFKGMDAGYILTYVLRFHGEAVGYSNIYLTDDMHNGELIAQEDTIYVVKPHRNGVGKALSQFILDDLRRRGVKRVHVTAVTDLRVAKLWQRMGFKPVAQAMTYTFSEVPDVPTQGA